MLSTRICFIAAVVLGLNACSRGTENPPAAVSSPDSQPVPPPAPPEKTEEVAAVNPPSPTPAPAPSAPAKAAPAKKVVPSNSKPPVPPPSTPRATPKVNAPAAIAPTSTAGTTTPATAPDSPIPLDLIALEKQLKATKAIGVFSKIALKNQVDDLMKKFREHYQGKGKTTMADLRQTYDLLMMKVLSMVQDNDKSLAAAIVSSRAAIWELLADPVKFAKLDA